MEKFDILVIDDKQQNQLLTANYEVPDAKRQGAGFPALVASRGLCRASAKNSWRILLAEDNDLSQKALGIILESRGLQVTVVSNGQEAVEAVKAGAFDLVLMDLQMPILDGFEATRALRTLPHPLCAIPILGLTAHVFREDLDKCLAAGMVGRVTKPVDFKALFAEIDRLLPISAGAAAPEIPEALVELMEAVAGDRSIAILLVGEFLVSYRASLDGISAAVMAGHAGELERRAHQFKGCLGVFCRTEPLELTQRLIELAEGKSLAEAPQTLEQLEIEMEKLVADLIDFVAR